MDDKMPLLIPRKEYERLVRRDKWLDYLEEAGVRSWEGIGDAIRKRNKDEEEAGGEHD